MPFQVDLDDAMDNFFNILYQKMFTVLNSQYNFDNKYLECVGEHMKEMRPFGDVPQKLSVQIKRSFVATRAFSQALTIAANVLKNMQTVSLLDIPKWTEAINLLILSDISCHKILQVRDFPRNFIKISTNLLDYFL